MQDKLVDTSHEYRDFQYTENKPLESNVSKDYYIAPISRMIPKVGSQKAYDKCPLPTIELQK
jgi:hypothetical protein